MGINQLGAFGIAPSPRTVFVANNGGQQQQVSLTGGALAFSLSATRNMIVPAGNWVVQAGQYSNLQVWDQQSYLWRYLSGYDQVPYMMSSDGTNYRIANTTGTVIGAVVTNRGTANTGVPNGFYGYNQALQFVTIVNGVTTTGLTTSTATISATTTGGALLNVFVGGSINTSITVVDGTSPSTGYTSAPEVIVVPPANQGSQPFIPATCKAVLTGSKITGITVINQGAGYVAAPSLLIVNQPGDTTGAIGTTTFTIALTNQNQLAAITVASGGTTAGGITSVPTITMSGTTTITSAAATALMNFSIVSLAINAVGAAYGNAQPTLTVAGNSAAFPTTTNTNPAIELDLVPNLVQPVVQAFSAAGGSMTATTATVLFGGYGFTSVPQAVVQSLLTIPTTQATWTVTTGGNDDTIYLYPI